MNALSWLIYLADALGGLKGFLAFLTGACAVGIFCILMGLIMNQGEYFEAERKALLRWFKPVIISMVVGGVVASIIPSRNTMYAIAASEMGEEVIKSETAGKAMKALDAWLDQQIAKSSPAASK